MLLAGPEMILEHPQFSALMRTPSVVERPYFCLPFFALFRLSARAMWPPLLNASQEAHHTHQRIKPDPAIMPIRRIKS